MEVTDSVGLSNRSQMSTFSPSPSNKKVPVSQTKLWFD